MLFIRKTIISDGDIIIGKVSPFQLTGNNNIIGEISIPDIEGITFLITSRNIRVICLKNSIKLLTGFIHDKIASAIVENINM